MNSAAYNASHMSAPGREIQADSAYTPFDLDLLDIPILTDIVAANREPQSARVFTLPQR